MKIGSNDLCPCKSKKKYKFCCQIFHKGSNPKNATLLMRSRFSAYAISNAKYIIKTTHPKNEHFLQDEQKWMEDILEFCKGSDFENLEILSDFQNENDAQVQFIATFVQNGEKIKMHEISQFEKIDGKWLYLSGSVNFLD